jgi:transposase
MDWSAEQLVELAVAAHHAAKPHVRVKALAVLAVAKGYTQKLTAELYDTSPASVNSWVGTYRAEGLSGFEVAPGRGRPRQADDDEVERYALQSPRNFGVDRSRWTLRLLAETVPCLEGFTDTGVRHALARCGMSYKRGQPWPLSPDPDFEKKDS